MNTIMLVATLAFLAFIAVGAYVLWKNSHPDQYIPMVPKTDSEDGVCPDEDQEDE